MSEGWNTIDSDAGVFSELVEKLHIKDIEFNDLYSIDEEYMKTMAPIYGVIFLFKYGNIDNQFALSNKPMFGEYNQNYQQDNIIFAKQTIHNACATIAVLNILLNVENIDLGPEISQFKSFISGFDSETIGDTISNSDLIRLVHNSFSSPSMIIDEDKSTNNQNFDNSELYHFIAYLPINGQLYELDGLKQYPITHGPCSNHQFLQKLPAVLNQRISKYGEELRFSCLAITNNKLVEAQNAHDEVEIQHQLQKRNNWARENELRKHQFNGLIFELLKNISRKCDDKQWNELLNDARKKSQSSLLQMLSKQKKM